MSTSDSTGGSADGDASLPDADRECVEHILREIMNEDEILTWWHTPQGELDGQTPWGFCADGGFELIVRRAFGYWRELWSEDSGAESEAA